MNNKFLHITTMAVLLLAAMTLGYSQNIPITLNQGWNWISYPCSEPMSIDEALAGFTPMPGDILRSQTDGSATYTNGRWRGSLTTLIPGKGYHYQSTDGTTRSFVFGGATNDPSALPEAALDSEFTVDANGTKVRFSPGNLQCRVNPTQETQTIVGTGTETLYQMPYNTYYCYSLCQMIYQATELHGMGLAAGPITGIAFQSNSDLHYLRDNIEIWMSTTTLSTAPTTSVSTSGMKKVFFGSVTQQTGWTEMAFTSSPFVWDGTSNVLVTVVMNHGSYNSPYIYWRCSSPGFTSSCYAYRDSSPYDPTTSTYSMNTSSSRPNTRFNGKGGATWRFAENQWDCIGEGNANISSSYTGWIDLFGWGTSGHPHGANCWQPWSTSTTGSDYQAYGGSYNLFDQTGEADWGCNPISNGGGKPNQWRTLTSNEWIYMLNTRSGKRYAKAQVNGVNGLIVLPDGWQTSYYSLSNTNAANAAYTSNTISSSQWPTLEQHGAVFLPATGARVGNTVVNSNTMGAYWSSLRSGTLEAYYVDFGDDALTVQSFAYAAGFSVRLVCQSNPRIRTIGVSNVTSTSATVSAEVDYTGSAGNRYICRNTTGNPTVVSGTIFGGTGTGSFNVTMIGLQPNTTYYVRACSYINGDFRYGNTLTFTTPDDGCNGHAYVDLGLPSGTLWATCNIGATNPEDYGTYFAWGETQAKSTYNWSTYQYCNGGDGFHTITKYCNDAEYGYNGYVDNIEILLPEDDAATANWGNGWRMPTKEEWQELYNNTTCIWTQQNGVNGILFTASNGNSLFLPAAGRYDSSLSGEGSNGNYWSSSSVTNYSYDAWVFNFNSGSIGVSGNYRCCGFTVRPVREN